ncbi:DNA polymerase LigD [Bailinhaonella thermotolerans]|uniref:DNA ligase (ATP) n=2 Tax=Bailinhaonella thermotolerans TaxID=1070861 RepID=A0A3A4B624_9ACTN|nr:DNA polymerase LigD [Bailinhaonella thermotolerans]
MLAVPGERPDDLGPYALEVKWDGVRAVSYVDGGAVWATSRKATDITARYPEIAAIGPQLAGRRAICDGEVVAFDELGRPSFERLQQRMHVSDPEARGLLTLVPVTYVVFDLLYLDGHPLFDVPYGERRALLDALELAGPVLAPPGGGEEMLGFTSRRGLEGVVAKRLTSPYRPGRRSPDWVKIKHLATQEVVIGGWKPGKGRRAGGIGSLLLGVYDGPRLLYAGHVGTGFTDAVLDHLRELLEPLEIPRSPYDEEVPREFARDARWVRPGLVGEVGYTMWTREGRLRTPTWRGLREDKRPEEVTRR